MSKPTLTTSTDAATSAAAWQEFWLNMQGAEIIANSPTPSTDLYADNAQLFAYFVKKFAADIKASGRSELAVMRIGALSKLPPVSVGTAAAPNINDYPEGVQACYRALEAAGIKTRIDWSWFEGSSELGAMSLIASF